MINSLIHLILIVYGHIQLFFVKSTPHLNYQFKAVINLYILQLYYKLTYYKSMIIYYYKEKLYSYP